MTSIFREFPKCLYAKERYETGEFMNYAFTYRGHGYNNPRSERYAQLKQESKAVGWPVLAIFGLGLLVYFARRR